ncbi:hypothetical protein EZJ43_08710 [Pedobacter changchengzhani]|uniref:Uncharacterized protein n=1 Tax=Pedobacter changchengzhani TaxID=2529274 RepID=A0A4R5MMS1_9SPHI|nr:hypothetical protein [Pedobacter changchengzhani]TDG36585.1 hypothetical protein EZJ43_08710 [Pedobacter changchengzhani]
MQKKYILFVLVLCCFSCKPKADNTNTTLLYFDLKGFFDKETQRLTKLNPTIEKLVSVDGSVEHETLKIADWENELKIFTAADINKAAWRGSFSVKKMGNVTQYVTDNKKISVKQISVEETNNQLKKIVIIIQDKNILYVSNDTLTYIPNVSYQIKKQQKIKLYDAKSYEVLGKF